LSEQTFTELARETAAIQRLRIILNQISHRPVHALGQNFLTDFNIIEKALRVAEPDSQLPVVEIGPGLGTLTGALLAGNWQVFAIERDRRLHAFLEERYRAAVTRGQLVLTQGDAVHHPRASLPCDQPFQVIANLPYAITSPWLEGILAPPVELPQRIAVMIQKESADRFRAEPGSKNFGPMSIFLRHAYRVRDAFRVPRRCFYPAPEVDSVFLCLDRLDSPLTFDKPTRRFIRSLFTQRRKQIQSTFKRLGAESLLTPWLAEAKLEPTLRPEQIPLSAWAILARLLTPPTGTHSGEKQPPKTARFRGWDSAQ